MNAWPHPRTLGIAAIVAFILGIGLLYLGFLKIAPLALFASVILAVLTSIAITAIDITHTLAAKEQADD